MFRPYHMRRFGEEFSSMVADLLVAYFIIFWEEHDPDPSLPVSTPFRFHLS
jgi:hypothetical protein